MRRLIYPAYKVSSNPLQVFLRKQELAVHVIGGWITLIIEIILLNSTQLTEDTD